MGMYDELRYLAPLPDGGPARPFQTKDLDCALDLYTVHEDGRLWVQSPWVGEHGDEPKRIALDGTVDFYDYDPSLKPDWIEYRATFKDGVVQSVVRLTPPDSKGGQ